MNTQSTRERNYKMIILNKQKFTKAQLFLGDFKPNYVTSCRKIVS